MREELLVIIRLGIFRFVHMISLVQFPSVLINVRGFCILIESKANDGFIQNPVDGPKRKEISVFHQLHYSICLIVL